MKYYFAPMEGITGYIYRSVHHEFFPGMEKYFTPFLSPGPKKALTDREIRDILPEHNRGMTVVPQILTNRSEDFTRTAHVLKDYGYQEVKGRGIFGIHRGAECFSGRDFSEFLYGNFRKNQNRERRPRGI